MSENVQGTQVFFLHDGVIHKFKCPQGIDGVGGEWEDVDATCLESEGQRTEKGMADGGTITIPFKFDSAIESHTIMQAMHEDPNDTGTQWAIGFSGSDEEPTVTNGALVIDKTKRSWITFEGRVKNGFAFELGQKVGGNLEIRVTSGIPKFFAKEAGGNT